MIKILQPNDWTKPSGYSNGIEARGRHIFVSGQIGWNAEARFESDDLVQQIHQALENAMSVLKVAGGGPKHVTRMTWYLLDKREYLSRLKEIGDAYKGIMGSTYPAMTAIQVAGLIEEEAKVEIEISAVIPD